MLINLTANEHPISSSVVGQTVFSVPKCVSLITFEERLFPQSFHPKAMNKSPELTFTVSLLLLPRISLKHACDKAVFCCASGGDSILEVPPLTKGHMERISYSPWLHGLENTFRIISHNLKSRRLNRNLGMALILTVNSNHPSLQGLIADSLRLTPTMLFSIHGIALTAGCLRSAI